MDDHQIQVVEDMSTELTLDPGVRQALSQGGVIDITTIGRTSGEPRRLEIVFHVIGGRIYISGMPSPSRRSWLANLDSDPSFTFHLKGPYKADLPAKARIITDEGERRRLMGPIAKIWKRNDVEKMVQQSPLIEVIVAGMGDGIGAV